MRGVSFCVCGPRREQARAPAYYQECSPVFYSITLTNAFFLAWNKFLDH